MRNVVVLIILAIILVACGGGEPTEKSPTVGDASPPRRSSIEQFVLSCAIIPEIKSDEILHEDQLKDLEACNPEDPDTKDLLDKYEESFGESARREAECSLGFFYFSYSAKIVALSEDKTEEEANSIFEDATDDFYQDNQSCVFETE